MAGTAHQGGTSFSRIFGLGIGLLFLIYNLWSFREHYLLKHSASTVQGTVLRTSVMRRKGGIAYNVDYGLEISGKHYEGTGQISSSAYLELRPGGPIEVRYASSDPTISETAEMSHDNVSLWLIGMLGIPTSLIILGVNLRPERLPEQYSQAPAPAKVIDMPPIELPNGIQGIAYTMYPVTDMKRARKFYEEDLGLRVASELRGEWVEYHVWDNCFAITTLAGDALQPCAEAGGRIAFEVNDVDDFVAKLRKKGIQIKHEPFSTPVCRMAVVLDPEGNALTLHHRTG